MQTLPPSLTTTRATTRNDVVVVGGRVAGMVAAARFAAIGMSVLVLEARKPSSPTLSTHYFRGAGLVQALADIGLLEQVLATGAPELRSHLRYRDGSSEPEASPSPEAGDVGFNLSVRRNTLDPLLAATVTALPHVEMRTQTPVAGLLRNHAGEVTGVVDADGDQHEAALVVGADGRRTRVAGWAGAEVERSAPGTCALYYQYVAGWRAPDGATPDAAEFSLLGDEMA